MPDGRTHRKIHRIFWPLPIASAGLLFYYALPWTWPSTVMVAVIPFGYWLGNLIDPDLDLPRQTEAERQWRACVIFLPMLIWWWLYAILAKAFGGHRSFLTHAPFISTAIRMVWFLLPFILLAYLSGVFLPSVKETSLAVLAGVYIGLSISDLVHVIADVGLLKWFF